MEHKKLYRSKKSRMIAGICGGLGEYFNVDPTAVRLVMVLLAVLGGGIGLILYLVMWIIIPEAPDTTTPPAEPTPSA